MRRLPFIPRFHNAIKSGAKTMTCRTRQYGEPGDLLWGPGVTLRLEDVRYVLLGDVAREHYREEGCSSPEEFEDVWRQIHPVLGYDEKIGVWLHTFSVVNHRKAPRDPSLEDVLVIDRGRPGLGRP